jgi:hypothetical protein
MEASINTGQIIKRLSLVKGLILLEEFEEAALHVKKLNGISEDMAIKEIIIDIDAKFYSDAVRKIEVIINKNQRLTLYEDPEIEALKIEIKKLEIDVSSTSDEVVEIEKLIHDFGIRHSRELGEIVSKILKLRKERLEYEQNESEGKKKEFDEAKKDYEEYSRQYEENKAEKQFELTEEEKAELKAKYRKATKLCHPDVVTDELKEYAETMFRELQEAYDKNDLKKVTEILNALEKGEIFIPKSEGINEKIKLKAEVIKLRKKLNELQNELKELKVTETYQTISKIVNWDEYFKETKQKLSKELISLEN